MKKLLFCSYLCIMVSLFCLPVSAEETENCTNADIVNLRKIAGNVSTDWEAIKYSYVANEDTPDTEPVPDTVPTYYKLNVNIYNITEDLRVVVENHNNNKSYNFTSEDADEGILALDAGYPKEIKEFTIKIYGSDTCYSEELKTFNITLPKYNEKSNYAICDEIPDYNMCKTFITTDIDMNETEFSKAARKYKEEQEKKKEEENNIPIIDFVKNHWQVILIVVVIVGIGGAVTYVIIKRNQRRRLV